MEYAVFTVKKKKNYLGLSIAEEYKELFHTRSVVKVNIYPLILVITCLNEE